MVQCSCKTAWTACLVAVLLAATMGAVFHLLATDHDPVSCRICAWLQTPAWLATVFVLQTCLFFQGLRPERASDWVSRCFRFLRSRSPPAG